MTAIGKSKLCDGFGLYSMENIKKEEFICEYKGEIVSKNESDRRSFIDGLIGSNYLFTLHNFADIDAHKVGNEMR